MTEQAARITPGQQVFAGDEEIGEITQDGVVYLHVRRFGLGLDDLFIPSIAVRQMVGTHVYLSVAPEELLGQAWHLRPVDQRTGTGS